MITMIITFNMNAIPVKNTVLLFGILLFALVTPLQAERYVLPEDGGSIVGQLAIISAREGDTFIALARKFGMGFQEIVLANPGVDPWIPDAGTQIVIPSRYILPATKREGLVINLAEMRLYYYPESLDGEPKYVHTYPISIGQRGWETPYGQTTRVIARVKNPTWYPPASIRKEHEEKNDPLPESVPPGPDNPLGNHMLRLDLPGYLIHGTNKPQGIGMKVTHGCIRLHPLDIEDLFGRVAVGTPVKIVNQPYKLAWRRGKLYAEMHPSEEGEIEAESLHLTQFVRAVIAVTKSNKDYGMDWKLANRLAKNKSGWPTIVGVQR